MPRQGPVCASFPLLWGINEGNRDRPPPLDLLIHCHLFHLKVSAFFFSPTNTLPKEGQMCIWVSFVCSQHYLKKKIVFIGVSLMEEAQ